MSAPLAAEPTTVAPPPPSRRAGLSLVEIVMATGVFSLLVTGIFGAMGASMKVEAMTREHQAASEAATRQLDLFMTDPALAFANSTTYFDVQLKTDKVEAATRNLLRPSVPLPTGWTGTQPGRVLVELNPNGLGDNLVRITTTVSWRSADGNNMQVSMISMRAR